MKHSLVLAILFLMLCASHFQAEASQPNVLLIVADDLGLHDLGCYSTDLLETPRLDQLAGESMRFTRAYAPAPVCSPTRAAILTGLAPARLKITVWAEAALNPPESKPMRPGKSLHDLDLKHITLAEQFRSAGYSTALVGKWHLGDASHFPESQGFDIHIGGNHWGAPSSFFFPYRGARSNGEYRYVPGLGKGKQGEYLTDRLTDEAIGAIDAATEHKKPFFVMLTHYAPHTPIEAPRQIEKRFESKRKADSHHQNAGYAAMVYSLDQNIGRLLDHLKAQRLDEDTIVIFTSDNGGYIGIDGKRNLPVTSNHPLRSGKASLYEGGLRVPLLIRWPKSISAGKLCDEPVILTDLYPTLGSLCKLPQMLPSDGVDLSKLLMDKDAELPSRSLYFHFPHYYHAPETTPCSALIDGNWKLVTYYETHHQELYNLELDPSEKTNLVDREPQRAKGLSDQLSKWLESIDAEMPTRN
jgi:arylsulfatase A-like enzyme